ncbi:Glucose/arabinose dehydrogenase, beta-propeller fold [Streptoalloteichus tenebrarius]|uniref:Glucose/arabinose dehydrogenase, beta-propeller fold n=1 Tax=Streptoalloteichus tenebrarius (strain ATCC 17920 / DSM 40477 / JCM 4838 / CBS 697.72 / NBRC 16177 / NCIMB 11028 / NRRL B-12390 / A12253. 1 / ISP 5477) TaxID=1933 RepID=A0ABT1HU00_STRSD|nr:PQQ-dependent sugar dehydrogenase [Streptoalloteichus tenebrarius]MCP2259001.1 Glucose/arabinose dehydrogenase, beta-propeller fold [Streptoalloteichus tenebrarius]BFF01212.1 PQQ-dependent sugar dehydrogenase [Streptoalloteichus tenebrarius]
MVFTRSLGLLGVVVVAAVAVAGCSGSPGIASSEPRKGEGPLRVEVVASGLEHGWDLGFLPDGRVLVPQRPGRLAMLSGTGPGAEVSSVDAAFDDVYVEHETGLMGLLVHPDFATTREFTTCQSHRTSTGEPEDVRLVTWRLAEDGRSAQRVKDPLLAGLPVNANGRHAGCRMELAQDGALLVGTGDAAFNGLAQDRSRLGGKVLRMNLRTGEPWPGNPWLDSPDPAERLALTYGHRNVQGVATRPGTEQVYVAEHGPRVDDEVNLVRPGGNYGWAPVGDPGGYDEDVPMTDLGRFPDAVPALWSSRWPTEAVCDAEFLSGPDWGDLDGTLAVTTLKGSKLILLQLSPDGEAVRQVAMPAELNGTHGRLRAAQRGPDGALYLTTSNGQDDKVLRVSRT